MRSKLAVLLLLLALLAPASAHAAGGLDREFGDEGGKTITDVSLGVPWSQADVKVAEAPDGDLVAAVGSKLLTYTAGGRLDGEFGDGGVVKVALPGSARFELGDVVVDPEGRIDLIGTAVTTSPPGRERSRAVVIRYLPEGRPDPSFGRDGVVVSAFGLRSRSLGKAAAVTASLGTVDGRGRITLAVATVEDGPWCDASAPESLARGLVRLNPDGSRDPSFGAGGIAPVGPIGTVTALASSPAGLVLAGPLPRSCDHGARTAVLALDRGGDRSRGFGEDGVHLFTGKAASVTVDKRGRTVVLFREKKDRATPDKRVSKIARLLPDGRLDPSFPGGWVYYNGVGPLYKWSSVVSEPGGALVLVGTLVKPLPPAEQRGGILFHRWMVAEPLRPDGLGGNWFGWLGYIAIFRFGHDADATATDALVDAEGDLVLAGAARRTDPSPADGLALARVELRH